MEEAVTAEKLTRNLRARGKENPPTSFQYVAKVYKKAAQIADLMTEYRCCSGSPGFACRETSISSRLRHGAEEAH